jgi:UDP-hydrolysing UDP-N-acetyl-D-glucosamine 2-epimerase
VTEGAFDEAIRHAVTKMAHLHFVAAAPYRDRVIQLGEAPERVFLVGGLGIDAIKQLDLMDREQLERSLDFRFGTRNLLITFHPPTLDADDGVAQMQALLDALRTLPSSTHLIFTMPNADSGSRELRSIVEAFVVNHDHAKAFVSLGQHRYLSCMRLVDGVVGNSSSGIIEAASFGVGSIDIGDRQRGRLKGRNVIDCAPKRLAIERALDQLFSDTFRAGLNGLRNPYGEGGSGDAIVAVLRRHPLQGLLKKKFHDMVPASSRYPEQGGVEK